MARERFARRSTFAPHPARREPRCCQHAASAPPCRSIAPLTLAIAGALLSPASPAAAQDGKDPATDLARIEVTGSNIRRSDVETASPVQVISKQDIQNMGARTLLQVLDNLPAARPAQQDARSLFTGSDGASQANLRGLGAQGTLVLLNGRRLSYYGAPAGFQTQFVNIDAIPAAAIERMEVLTDGARQCTAPTRWPA